LGRLYSGGSKDLKAIFGGVVFVYPSLGGFLAISSISSDIDKPLLIFLSLKFYRLGGLFRG
jgi:hypothetical protein